MQIIIFIFATSQDVYFVKPQPQPHCDNGKLLQVACCHATDEIRILPQAMSCFINLCAGSCDSPAKVPAVLEMPIRMPAYLGAMSMWFTEKPPLAKPARPKAQVVAVTPPVTVRALGINMSAMAAPRKPAGESLTSLPVLLLTERDRQDNTKALPDGEATDRSQCKTS